MARQIGNVITVQFCNSQFFYSRVNWNFWSVHSFLASWSNFKDSWFPVIRISEHSCIKLYQLIYCACFSDVQFHLRADNNTSEKPQRWSQERCIINNISRIRYMHAPPFKWPYSLLHILRSNQRSQLEAWTKRNKIADISVNAHLNVHFLCNNRHAHVDNMFGRSILSEWLEKC